MESEAATVRAIYRYPVKGLSPQALERARLRHASRLFDNHTTQVSKADLIRLEPEDFLASRVFQQAAEDVADRA